MISIAIRLDVLGPIVERLEVPGTARESAATLISRVRRPEWGDGPIGAAVDGHVLTGDELTMPLADGSSVVIGPSVAGVELATFAILTALLAATAFVSRALITQPTDVAVPVRRDEESSPAYAFTGIQTEYQAGFPVPLILGEHDVGGTAIFSSLRASGPQATPSGISDPEETLRVVIALGEGPIHAVGGVTADSDLLGAMDGQSIPPIPLPLPTNIRVNNHTLPSQSVGTVVGTQLTLTPNAQAFVRLGSVTQTPLPSNAFPGNSFIDEVGQELRDDGAAWTHTLTYTGTFDRLSAVVEFPAGLYSFEFTTNDTPARVYFQARWRYIGDIAWRGGVGDLVVASPTNPVRSPFSSTLDFTPNNLFVAGPVEVELRRTRTEAFTTGGWATVPSSTRTLVSHARWRNLNIGIGGPGSANPVQFSYPRTALLGLAIRAREDTSGHRPAFIVRVRGLKVRVFDQTIGSGSPSAATYWDVPASGDPYFGIWTYPPGRNPAWCLAALLLHQGGLGELFSASMIDWPSFRDWADFCDQDATISLGTEALLQFDGVIDSPTSAWDWVARICQAGRATPVLRGHKLSVVYQYSDAHGRGTNVVPAKGATQLINSSNVRDFAIRYHNTEDRPAVILAQFLNEEKNYAQDTLSIEDPEGRHNDPTELNQLGFEQRHVRFYGVTRPSQITREVLFAHRASGRTSSTVTFEIGPEALAAEVGDVIAVQHHILKPSGQTSFGMRCAATVATSTTFTVDRDVTIGSGTWVAVIRDKDGAVITRTLSSTAGTYPAGSNLTITVAADIDAGAPIAIGQASATVKLYEIRDLTLTQDLMRSVTATEWHAEVHAIDDVTESLPEAGGVGGQADGEEGNVAIPALSIEDDVADVELEAVRIEETDAGDHVVSWSVPDGMAGRKARVWVRLADSDQRWTVLGESSTGSLVAPMVRGSSYEVRVAWANVIGDFGEPTAPMSWPVGEFASRTPATVHGFRVDDGGYGNHLTFTWHEVPHASRYEVRAMGEDHHWYGGRLIEVTTEPRAERAMPGYWDDSTNLTFAVRAFLPNGMPSARAAVASVTPLGPTLLELDDHAFDTTGATITNLASSVSGGALTLSATTAQEATGIGSCVFASRSLGYDADAWISLYWESWIVDHETCDADDGLCGDGDAHWSFCSGRPASPLRPGLEVGVTIDDLEGLIEDAEFSERCGAPAGEAGAHGEVRVWTRTARTGETIGDMPWVPYHAPYQITHNTVQVKVEVWWERSVCDVTTTRWRLWRWI